MISQQQIWIQPIQPSTMAGIFQKHIMLFFTSYIVPINQTNTVDGFSLFDSSCVGGAKGDHTT